MTIKVAFFAFQWGFRLYWLARRFWHAIHQSVKECYLTDCFTEISDSTLDGYCHFLMYWSLLGLNHQRVSHITLFPLLNHLYFINYYLVLFVQVWNVSKRLGGGKSAAYIFAYLVNEQIYHFLTLYIYIILKYEITIFK